MPMLLDHKTEYQLGIFLAAADPAAPPAALPRNAITGLRRHFDTPPRGSTLKVKFRDTTVEDGVVAIGGRLVPVPTIKWVGGPWRMEWTPLRLDVYADARAYADVADRPLDLDAVTARIVPGLERAAVELGTVGFVTHRLVLVLTGERVLDPGDPASLGAVAGQFLPPDVRDAAARGDAWDVGARVDWGTRIDLGESAYTPIHRIENVGTQLSYAGTDANLMLRAQWDVNTSPQRGTSALPSESFSAFFTTAAGWITERRSRLESV